MIGYTDKTEPHPYRVGDEVRTTFGRVGVVTEVLPYSVTLDDRLHVSQTQIEGRVE